MLRIGLDGRILMHYEMRGFARYTVELFRALQEIAGDGLELVTFSPGPIAPEFLAELQIQPMIFGARREILWEQVELPKQLRQARIDIFHVTANRGLPYRRACKYVVTCHDIIDRLPEYCMGEHWRGRLRKRYSDFISRHSADKYITVSNFSKQDICRYHHLGEERVVVIHNAASRRFYERLPAAEISRIRQKYDLPPEYFLFLGGFDQKKNVGALVRAFALLQDCELPNALSSSRIPPLVLAGERKWDFENVALTIRSQGLAQTIVCPGQIDDEDLPGIYQGALALVHPSRYEGFGLQLVEAMASGIPVLASQTTSLPEVLNGAGLLFDADDPASIAGQMARVVSDAGLRADLAEKSRQRARFFSWHKAAQETLSVYQQLLGGSDDTLRTQSQPATALPERRS